MMNVDRSLKRGLVCVAVVALAGTSLATAGPALYEIPPLADLDGFETASEGHAITPDGKYVAVAVDGATTTGSGAVWDVVGGTRRVRDLPGNLSKNATGIGYITVDGSQRLVVHAAAEGPRDCYWISADGGVTWGRYKPGLSTGFVATGTSNTLAGSGSGDAFYGAYDETSLKFWGVTGTGDPPSFVGSPKSTTAEAGTKGVAAVSPVEGKKYRVVGYRKDANGFAQNYVMDYDGTGASPANWYPTGLSGDRQGELWAIAANTGTRVGGRSPLLFQAGLWAFISDNPVADGGIVTQLPTFNPLAGYAGNSIVYGLSPDGRYAVGMDYTLGGERAVLWDLADLGNIIETDLSQFALDHGILGNFTTDSPLRRAYAVGVADDGTPVVTGRGVVDDGVGGFAYRGFVAYVATGAVTHPGDANKDGKVDDLDASILAANWQRTGGATWAQADFNADGNVNDLDASILAANWQYGVGAAVPEPAGWALLVGLAVLPLARRARRRR